MSRVDLEKRKHIEILAGQLRQIKTEVDVLYNEQVSLQGEIEEYLVQYNVHVVQLEERKAQLERELDDCIFSLNVEPATDEEVHDSDPHQEQVDFSEDKNDDLAGIIVEPGVPNEEGDYSDYIEEMFDTGTSNIADDKNRIRIFFARMWHPDVPMSLDSSGDLMKELNVTFAEDVDAADMLAHLPWNDSWIAQTEKETIGEHWERLVEWLALLSEAKERIELTIKEIRHQGVYADFEEWVKTNRSKAYFTEWTAKIRKDIANIQHDLEECESELKTE